LLDVESVEARATRIAEQNDPPETLAAQEIQSSGDVEQRKLVLEAQVRRRNRIRRCPE
jgi:hypothetical protein